jgi:hypothetical protein
MNLKSRVNDTDTDNLKKLIKKRDEVKRKMTLLKQDESIYEIVIYGISGLFKILPTRGICNLRGLARVGYYLEWVVLNNPRMPYNVLSNIPKFLDNDIIDEILLPMGYER